MPLIVAAWIGWLEYGYCYVLCYTRLPRSSSIPLIVIYNALLLVLATIRIIIGVRGPGYLCGKVLPYNLDPSYQRGRKYVGYDYRESPLEPDMNDPPEIFECIASGVPEYCEVCKTIKVLRSHHSRGPNRCACVMDHYCGFIGSLIGQANFGWFLTFVVLFQVAFLLVFITTLAFIHYWRHHLHWAIIVTVIGSFVMFGLVSNLAVTEVIMISHNQTTMERLSTNRLIVKQKAYNRQVKHSGQSDVDLTKFTTYVNVQHPHLDIRVVIALGRNDHPYDTGSFWANLQHRCGRSELYTCPDQQKLLTWSEEMFSPAFRQTINSRIEQGQFTVFGSQPW